MCKCLWDFFDCMCCVKYAKSPRRRKRHKRSSTKYGTDWQTMADDIEDPTLIDDKMVTKEINMGQEKFKDRTDYYNEVLKQLTEPSDLMIAERDPLGRGAFGQVYKLTNTKTGVFYAMKVMKVGDKEERDTTRFKSFRNEIFTLTRSKHRNIIQLIGHFLVENYCFMIMEFATDGDLKKRFLNKYGNSDRGCSEMEAKCFFVQIANALYFVHGKGLIHGDLKLENILLTYENDKEVIKVSDFGCARVGYNEEKGEIRQKGRAVGTVTYMAPEQLRVYLAWNLNCRDLTKHGNSYNPQKADMWSLGICLYRMLTNKSPFEYDKSSQVKSVLNMLDIMKEGFDLPKHVAKTVGTDCLDMLYSLLEYEKHKRIAMDGVIIHPWLFGDPNLDKPRQ